jgi:hypothetical protein
MIRFLAGLRGGSIGYHVATNVIAMFRPHARTAALLALMLAPRMVLAGLACMPEQNLDVPQSGEGLYINLVNGDSGTAEAQVPGFDFDPYASQNSDPADQLKFYWGPSSNGGAGVATSGDVYAVLLVGATIGPDSLFTRAGFAGDTSAWQAGVIGGYLGARFTNEAAGILNYGWIRLDSSAPLGFPLTVVDWCYEDSGAPITIEAQPADNVFCDGFEGVACPVLEWGRG